MSKNPEDMTANELLAAWLTAVTHKGLRVEDPANAAMKVRASKLHAEIIMRMEGRAAG